MSRTVRGSLSGDRDRSMADEDGDGRGDGRGKKKRHVERKPTFLSFFKVKILQGWHPSGRTPKGRT